MKPVLIKNKYHGRCLFCGQEIEIDKKILWQPGTGIAHPDHFSEEEKQIDYLLDQFQR